MRGAARSTTPEKKRKQFLLKRTSRRMVRLGARETRASEGTGVPFFLLKSSKFISNMMDTNDRCDARPAPATCGSISTPLTENHVEQSWEMEGSGELFRRLTMHLRSSTAQGKFNIGTRDLFTDLSATCNSENENAKADDIEDERDMHKNTTKEEYGSAVIYSESRNVANRAMSK